MVDAGDIATIATAAAVLVALAVGLAQVRETQRQRREQAAVELMHDLVTPQFTTNMRSIFDLPVGAPPEEVRRRGLAESIHQVDFPLEALGTLICHRVIEIGMVDDLCGGMIREGWARAAPFVEAYRAEKGWPTYGEWWQWLAERLAERHRERERMPAQLAYRDWRE